MIRSLVAGFLLNLILAVPAFSQPSHLWSRSFGDPVATGFSGAAFDDAGNLFVAGVLYGSLTTEKGTLTAPASAPNVLLMSFDPSGVVRWARRFGDANGQMAYAIAMDGGNIVIAGVMWGTVDFGGGPLTAPGTSSDIFVAKFDNNGTHLWSKRFGDTSSQSASDIAVSDGGDIFVTGTVGGSFAFDGIPACPLPFGICNDDVFVARLASDGSLVWGRRIYSSSTDTGDHIGLDPAGNLIVSGYHANGSLDLGGGPLSEPDGNGAFLAKFSPDMNHIWSRDFDLGHIEFVVDHDGNVAAISGFSGDASFGGATFHDPESGVADACIAKFDNNGAHLWSQQIGGQGGQFISSLSVDAGNNIYMAGFFDQSINFGTAMLTNIGYNTPFLASYGPSGDYAWGINYPTAGNTNASTQTLALNNQGVIAMMGRFWGTIDFGGGPLTNPNASPDPFVAAFAVSPVPVLITDFTASASEDHVALTWRFWSDEALESFSVFRRESFQELPVEIASGPVVAADGTYVDTHVRAGGTYEYQLLVRSSGGDEIRSQTRSVTIPALRMALGANTPNPFSGSTTIEYSVAGRAPVSIGIYDVRGARVALLDQGVREPGAYRVVWNGRDDSGRAVGNGVYFYRFEGNRAIAAKKMIHIK